MALGKMKITHLPPADTDPTSAAFGPARDTLLGDLDKMIAKRARSPSGWSMP
jgi:hypothetical protein